MRLQRQAEERQSWSLEVVVRSEKHVINCHNSASTRWDGKDDAQSIGTEVDLYIAQRSESYR